jgi:hypothetical protein
MQDEEVDQCILSGAYRLHDFAAATWLELSRCCINSTKQEYLPSALTDILETLMCQRAHSTHTESAESFDLATPKVLRSKHPALYNMLCEAAGFHQTALKSGFNRDKGSLRVLCFMCLN